MKSIKAQVFIVLLSSAFIFACNQKKTAEVTTSAEEITTTDSSAVVVQPDSLQLDPQTQETALQQDPPPANQTQPNSQAKTSNQVCDPNFNYLAKPKSSMQFFYISGFNPGEFKCWVEIEKHGHAICGSRPCVIYYFDTPEVNLTANPPHFVGMETLMKHGIGRYEYNGKYWQLQGAREWNRREKGYGYFNTDNQLGG